MLLSIFHINDYILKYVVTECHSSTYTYTCVSKVSTYTLLKHTN